MLLYDLYEQLGHNNESTIQQFIEIQSMISRSAENDYVQNEKPITWKSTSIQEAANVKCNQQPYKEKEERRSNIYETEEELK